MPWQDSVRNLESTQRALNSVGLRPKHEPRDIILPLVGLFSAGLAVGVTLGLLFAPRSGNDLRRGIQEKVRRREPTHTAGPAPNGLPKANNPYLD